MRDATQGSQCPVKWCAYPMPHEHQTHTASAAPPPKPTWVEILQDPTQQLDPEGVVLATVLARDSDIHARLTTAEREWLSDAMTYKYPGISQYDHVLRGIERILTERLAARQVPTEDDS